MTRKSLKRAKDPLVLARVCEANGVRHPADCVCAAGRARALAHEEAGRRRRRPYRHGGSRGAALGPILIFNVALAERASRLYSSRAKRKRKLLASACSGPRQRRTSPFRYGGAAGPVDIDPAQAEEIARSVAAIASELDLVGLNSADFLVSADAVWLIEINPRPGATLDIRFERGAVCASYRRVRRTSDACLCKLRVQSSRDRVRPARYCRSQARGIGRIGRSTDRRRGHRSPSAILCARHLALARPSIWRAACASERARRIIALVQEADH